MDDLIQAFVDQGKSNGCPDPDHAAPSPANSQAPFVLTACEAFVEHQPDNWDAVANLTAAAHRMNLSTNSTSNKQTGLFEVAYRNVTPTSNFHMHEGTTTSQVQITAADQASKDVCSSDVLATSAQQLPTTYRQFHDPPVFDHHSSLASNPWSTEDDNHTSQAEPIYTPEDAWSTISPPSTPPHSPTPTYTPKDPWHSPYTDSDNEDDGDKPLPALPLPQSKTQVRILIEAMRLSNSASVSRDERQSLLVDKHKAVQQHRKALKTSAPAWQRQQKTWREVMGLGKSVKL